MKRSTVITAALVSSMVFSGYSVARGIQSDLEDDMLYGTGQVAASYSGAFVYTGPVRDGEEDELLYSRHRLEPTTSFEGYQRLADDRDSSTDLIYGPHFAVGAGAQHGLVGGCPVNQTLC